MLKTLRSVHLYLGCVFAPMLFFFAISGIWQTRMLRLPKESLLKQKLSYLSTLHTGRGLKDGSELSSPYMEWIVVAMALALIATIVLGVIMAFKFGRGKIAMLCLAAGILLPLLVIYLTHGLK